MIASCTGGTNACLTKGLRAIAHIINQVKYSPKYQSVAIVGTNDGNVQIGFNLGTGVANQGNWVNVTGNNEFLPNRPILGIALDPTVSAANLPVGYAAVGGFNANTPATPGHVFQVTCVELRNIYLADKSGNLPDIPVDSVISNPELSRNRSLPARTSVLYYTITSRRLHRLWFRFNNGLPAVMIWDMQIDRGARRCRSGHAAAAHLHGRFRSAVWTRRRPSRRVTADLVPARQFRGGNAGDG